MTSPASVVVDAGANSGLFGWWRAGSTDARRALIAAGLGWMLDAFDVMMYALLLPTIMADLNISSRAAGAIGSGMLLAAAAGGLAFGVVADRYGRTRALMASVTIYSVFAAACGLATTAVQLAIFRILLGIGMGGEWASGAALVSETWPARDRGKALGLMQSAWAVGYGLAALVTMIVLPRWGWRMVFFIGVLPALLTVWVRRYVREPELWLRRRETTRERARLGDVFRDGRAGVTAAVTAMNACTLFAWWGFNLWLPGFLSAAPAAGGIGLSATGMSWFIIAMQVGMWFGYITFGYVSDVIGRKRAYIGYLVTAGVLIAIYASLRSPVALLLLGPFVAFFATGYFSGFGAVTAEIYPTEMRATAQGFTYNLGRIASAAAPFTVGTLAQTRGFDAALSTTSVAFMAAAVLWLWIPETRGRELA
ncbi:MAG: MFS transporter [Vicinamibacterales bacterium]